MRYSTFRCKIIVDIADIGKCRRFLDDNECNPVLLSRNENSGLFVATMTPEERLILKLKINNLSISDYHIHETDRLAR